MVDKIFKQLKLIFISSIVILTLLFIVDVIYTTKYTFIMHNDILERWCIILTLVGIFASLRWLHPKLKESEKEDQEKAIKIYAKKYYFRLSILIAICILNMVSLYFTGAKNFMFLAFITIFAIFLCAPNKQQIEKEESNLEN